MEQPTPPPLRLREYQQEAVDWLRAHKRGILALDVGLGKTITALAAQTPPTLVVAPAHLTYQWFNTAVVQMPHVVVSLPEGTRVHRQRELNRGADVTIVNYEMIRGKGYTHSTAYNTLIIDEAHRIRKRTTAQSKAAYQLANEIPHVMLLTASPYYKGAQDIWNLLRTVDYSSVGGYWDFLREWFAVNWAAPYTPKIYGVRPTLRDQFRQKVAEYMFSRTYADVGRELPPLIEKHITVRLPFLIQRIYTEARNRYILLGSPLESAGATIATLRALTMNHIKQDAVVGIVDDLPPSQPALIYVWYKESARLLSERLTAAHQPHVTLTGDTAPLDRAQLLDTARHNGYHVIATQASLSEGANLQHMRHVIYAEESYVPEEHRQTLARVRRDRNDDTTHNETEPVVAYYVRTQHTIDENIARARARGARSIQEVVRTI